MSLSELALPHADEATAGRPADIGDLIDSAEQLAASLNGCIAAGRAGAFPDQTMRHLMAALVKVYAAKFDEGQRPILLDDGIFDVFEDFREIVGLVMMAVDIDDEDVVKLSRIGLPPRIRQMFAGMKTFDRAIELRRA